LASALRAVGRVDEAEAHFAFVRKANQKLADLEGLLERVRENPKAVQERYQVGRTLMLYASPPKGAAWLRSVLEVDPHHGPTHRMLADYYAERNDQQLAERHRRQAGLTGDIEEGL
jgi:hypothetical protein